MCAIHAPFYLSKIKIPEFQSISDSKVLSQVRDYEVVNYHIRKSIQTEVNKEIAA